MSAHFFPATCRRTAEGVLAIALASLSLATSGCVSGPVLKATSLPAEYRVAHAENAQTIDLSKLANFAVKNNLIERGDVLEVTVETGLEERHDNNSFPMRVAEDGTANVPVVGRVSLAGLELTAAEQVIRDTAVEREVYRNPTVTVVMKQQRTNTVTVVGAVVTPGVYELPRSSSTLLAALVQAEGLSENAGSEVELRHPAQRAPTTQREHRDRVAGATHELTSFTEAEPVASAASTTRINLVAAAKEGSKDSYYLEDGDVVMVEKRDPAPIHVMGLVTRPGQFQLPANKDVRVLDAIALAGGLTNQWADKIHVIRHPNGREEPLVIAVNIREAKRIGQGNLVLGPGDVVSVEVTPLTVAVDTLKNFARFSFGATTPLPAIIK